MPLASVFLLSVVLSATVDPASPAAQPPTSSYQSNAAVTQFEPAPALGENNLDPMEERSSNICFKIRAYIFESDDDHAPKFVRSTTCGPATPRVKSAAWPAPKVVPAK